MLPIIPTWTEYSAVGGQRTLTGDDGHDLEGRIGRLAIDDVELVDGADRVDSVWTQSPSRIVALIWDVGSAVNRPWNRGSARRSRWLAAGDAVGLGSASDDATAHIRLPAHPVAASAATRMMALNAWTVVRRAS